MKMNSNNMVQVFTTLPPCIKKVDPFFYLHFQINYVKFTSKNNLNYENIDAKVLWWGEEGAGSIFTPRCVNLAGYKQSVKTYAIYNVCVPLNHFTIYLGDMDKLYIDIIDKTKHSVVGRAIVEDIKQLGCNKTFQSLCNIYNESRNKIGELMVVMTLEPGRAFNNVELTYNKANSVMEANNEVQKNENLKSLTSDIKSPRYVAQLTESIDRMEKSQNLIDDIIEKGKRLRETIAINVKDDEINENVAKRTFPQLLEDAGNLPSDNEWIKKVLAEPNSINFSLNDISKINTESILELSPNMTRKHRNVTENCNLNNDKEALKLLTVSDSYCSEFDSDIASYKNRTRSVEDIIKFEKELSSDDDPGKHDSIIEELFYKQTDNISEINSGSKNIQQRKPNVNSNNNKVNALKSDFEIYKSLSQNQKDEVTAIENINNDMGDYSNNDDLDDNEPNDNMDHYSVDSNWYRNISAIKVYIDMLWLNPYIHSPNKSSRSRSQSPNYSSDREKCRRSHDSASSFNNSSVSTTTTKPPISRCLQWNPSCKYFVEYKFPSCVPDECDREKENYSIIQSPIRVAVKSTSGSNNNNVNGVRAFELNHSSEFPVSFNNATIEQWWKRVVRFRLICQDCNRKETCVGVSVLSLRNIISTNNFYRLIPMRLPRNKVNKSRVVVGSLAIRTTMALSTNNIMHSQINHDSLSKDHRQQICIKNPRSLQNQAPRSMSAVYRNTNRPVLYRLQKSTTLCHTTPSMSPSLKMSPLNLVSLLSVTSVRYINTKMISGDYRSGISSCNLYLIGRLLWAPDHKIKSRILWGSSKISDSESSLDLENFKLSEKIPLILTSDLMDKLKNNYAILEVWDKSMDNTKDTLYGLVKIPMNMLCVSFGNDLIRMAVLKNVYPMMCCDDWVNVEDTITGKSKGQIHVMLALGSHNQIDNLELSKENTSDGHWNRNYIATTLSCNDMVEHSIEIDVESLRNVNLSHPSKLLTRDSFCYIQYYFPQQQTMSESNARNWVSSTFRSVSHPLQANVDITDTNKHRFRLPIDCSLKGSLNNHFDVMGKKYILFELYTKQYNPFPSSKSIAKGRLPIASLFQLFNQHSVCVDSMADTLTRQQIPIRLVSGDEPDSINSAGILNIGVCYKTKLLNNNSRNVASTTVASPFDQPIVKIEVISATGLQKSAETLVRIHPELEYASVTGVNSHVKYWLTDESNKQSRINVNSKGFQKFKIHKSKTVPHSFIPKYDSINEVLLGPIVDDTNSNSLYRTLAEKILMGIYQLNVELYHDVPKSIYCDFEEETSMSTILIGKGRVSLADILLRSNGIMGPIWLTLFSPMNLDSGFGGYKLNITGKKKFDSLYSIEKRIAVGALEIRLSLNDKSDRRNILQLAMDAGYVVPWTTRLETEDLIWQSMDVHGCSFKNISVTIEEVELSAKLINCVFTSEAGYKRSSMKILTRYKIYKHAIASSPYFMLNEEELKERIFIPVNHQQQYCYRVSSDLFRYLRESKLEIQVWSIYGSSAETYFDNDYEQTDNPNDVRLLGSAYFDLSSLIIPSDGNHKTVSNILPLWKRGIPNCDSANVTVTVEICGATSPLDNYSSDIEDDEYGSRNVNIRSDNSRNTIVDKTRMDNKKSFPAHIIIEKAVNLNELPGKKDPRNSTDLADKPLNYFVSFPCVEDTKNIHSSIVKGHRDVTWNFECDTRLSYTLLTGHDNNLDFKLYHSKTESELFEEINDQKSLTGTAKIDLSLLLKGFERVIGWYNIIDMQGDCQGQIKIGVTPLIPLVPKSAIITTQKQSQPPMNDKPLTLEDHQDYLAKMKMRLRGEVTSVPTFSTTPPQRYCNGDSSQDFEYQNTLSKSILYSTLKEKLKELDHINETLKKKISKDEFTPPNSNDNNNALLDNWRPELPINIESRVDNCGMLNNDRSLEQLTNMKEDVKISTTNENDFNDDMNESGSDFYEDQDEEGISRNIVCINDTDQTRDNDQQDTYFVEDFERDSIFQTEHIDGDKISVYDSESDCSIVSFNGQEGVTKTSFSGRSSVLSNPKNYNEVEIDEIIGTTHEYPTTFAQINNDLNDSWESETFQQPVNLSPELNELPTPKTSQKTDTNKSIIPRFFPPSIDFQEKMRALKRTIDVDRNHSVIDNNTTKTYSTDKKTPLSGISDTEARRLSKIFGIK